MKYLLILLMAVVFIGCAGSPKNAFALKTEDYGQCRMLEEGERIFYKKKRVSYICEDGHVLFSKPYEKDEEWYFSSGFYDGKKVKNISSTKVLKTFHKICQLEGSYGTGNESIRKFYFNTKIKACQPFEYSGENGISLFDSRDECEVFCHY